MKATILKISKRIAACMLIVTLMLSATGCAKRVTVLEYNGSKMDSGTFAYALSDNKTYQLYMATGATSDISDFWAYTTSEGTSYGQLFMDSFVENCKLLLISDAKCKELGLQLTEDQLANASNTMSTMVEQHGTMAEFNVYLSSFGINADDYNNYMKLTSQITTLMDYYYGDNGVEKITEQANIDYLKENYSLVQHIFYRPSKTVTVEESGATSGDTSASTSAVESDVSMTEEEKAALKAEVTKKYDAIKKGEKKYEDYVSENQDSGSLYLVNSDSQFVEEFLNAALEMKVGEVRMVETTYGFHIMRKLDITTDNYDDLTSAATTSSTITTAASSLKNKLLYDMLSKELGAVKVTQSEIDKYNVATAPVIS